MAGTSICYVPNEPVTWSFTYLLPVQSQADTEAACERVNRLIAEDMSGRSHATIGLNGREIGQLYYSSFTAARSPADDSSPRTETAITWDAVETLYDAISASGSYDSCCPDTSQKYFLDLIDRINAEIQ
jgi:hypothetical protein